uniref:C2H2-type domain-containing protein n=1 Tax=Heterorhabditis bacteriophora TaxID=37862 RepID=A0A1I7WV56_HETBA
MLDNGEKFYDVIFIDKSTFQVDCKSCNFHVKKGGYFDRLHPRAIHLAKLHV